VICNIVLGLSSQHGGQQLMMTKFTRRQELGKSNPKMILVSLEPEEKVAFSPGDHMIMYPTNAVEEVDFLLSKFIDKDKRTPEKVLQLQECGSNKGRHLKFFSSRKKEK